MNFRIFLLSGALLGIPAGIVACASDDPPPPAVVTERNGLVLIDWTIDGHKNPEECDQSDADALLISIWTHDGAHVADFEQYCQVFESSVALDPGTYTAEALLIAPDGIERTLPVEIPPFDITGNDMFEVRIDLPSSSFY